MAALAGSERGRFVLANSANSNTNSALPDWGSNYKKARYVTSSSANFDAIEFNLSGICALTNCCFSFRRARCGKFLKARSVTTSKLGDLGRLSSLYLNVTQNSQGWSHYGPNPGYSGRNIPLGSKPRVRLMTFRIII